MQAFNLLLQVGKGKHLEKQYQSSDSLVPRVSKLSQAFSRYFPDSLSMLQLKQRWPTSLLAIFQERSQLGKFQITWEGTHQLVYIVMHSDIFVSFPTSILLFSFYHPLPFPHHAQALGLWIFIFFLKEKHWN